MAMFDDPKKELKKLEEQLLKEEDWFEKELEVAKALIGDEEEPKPAQSVSRQTARVDLQQTQMYRTQQPEKISAADKVRKNAVTDVNLDEDGGEEHLPKRKRNRGLVITAVLETLGIVGIVAYWLIYML